MKPKIKAVLGVAALALFVTGAVISYKSFSDLRAKQAAARNGGDLTYNTSASKTKAADFTVIDSEGNSVKLSDMAGKPVVLNFWASWCPPCRVEMPDFDRVYKETGSEIKFMMVDLVDGQRETVETGAGYIRENGYSFPVYFDTEREGAAAYNVRYIPTTVFINSDGYVVNTAQGAINEVTLRKNIELIR